MIEEFSFGNFKSFKELQSLNMTAAKIKSKNTDIDRTNLITVNDKLSLLKSKAIYGANASGKSNVVKVLDVFINIVKSSVKDENVLMKVDSFRLSTETEDTPTFFQLIFRIGGVKYRYGFESDSKIIHSEWLYSTPNQREVSLFIRDGDEIIDIKQNNFKEGALLMSFFDGGKNVNLFRKNSLFLSTVASFGVGELSRSIIEYFSSILFINGIGHSNMFNSAIERFKDDRMRDFVSKFLKSGDVGINDLGIIEYTKNSEGDIEVADDRNKENEIYKTVLSARRKYDEGLKEIGDALFVLSSQESEGTKKMFELGPYIYDALKNGKTIVIDEFDARFHPLLTKKIVELFNSEESTAQLIFTTHDTNLLSSDLLRRDQIDFVEKDKYGASHLYTLVQFKGIRNTASFEKDYIHGKYGAIPFLGNFRDILNFEEDAEEN